MGLEDLGTLNLADADTTGGDFEPLKAGTYDMHVHDVKMVEIEHDNGKLPQGTPGYNIQFRVDGGKYDNRVVFKRYYLPPEGYDAEKRKKSLGIFVNFLVAMGYDKAEVMSGSYSVDVEDWIGRTLKVTVKVRPADEDKGYAAQNEVTSVKAITAAGSSLGDGAGVL